MSPISLSGPAHSYPAAALRFGNEERAENGLVRNQAFQAKTSRDLGSRASDAAGRVRDEWAALGALKQSGIKGLVSAGLLAMALKRDVPPIFRIAAGLGATALLASAGVNLLKEMQRINEPLALPKPQSSNPLEALKEQLSWLLNRERDLDDQLPDGKLDQRGAIRKAVEQLRIQTAKARLERVLREISPKGNAPKLDIG